MIYPSYITIHGLTAEARSKPSSVQTTYFPVTDTETSMQLEQDDQAASQDSMLCILVASFLGKVLLHSHDL